MALLLFVIVFVGVCSVSRVRRLRDDLPILCFRAARIRKFVNEIRSSFGILSFFGRK